MKASPKPVLLFLRLLALLLFYFPQGVIAQQNSISPTPTYDPLAEPPLPPQPSEYELGRNLYWHWCMTCHGDRGQGLTDEFRAIWPPEHQNCWGRGCHSGRPGETGFPIPTTVPALVDENHLRRFTSRQGLADFLQATHPPQSPGILKREEYQAIALFIFTLNGRTPDSIPVTETPAPAPTQTLSPSPRPGSGPALSAILLLTISLAIILMLLRKTAHRQR